MFDNIEAGKTVVRKEGIASPAQKTPDQLQDNSKTTPMTLTITSSAFKESTGIPGEFTCDGLGINPPLEFHGIPTETESLVLVMDDPDVPTTIKADDGVFDHWVVFNIDPSVSKIGTGEQIQGTLGVNGTSKTGYIGPCPPNGEHRYFFKLYALDRKLNLKEGASKTSVLEAAEGHIIEEAELMDRYERKK